MEVRRHGCLFDKPSAYCRPGGNPTRVLPKWLLENSVKRVTLLTIQGMEDCPLESEIRDSVTDVELETLEATENRFRQQTNSIGIE